MTKQISIEISPSRRIVPLLLLLLLLSPIVAAQSTENGTNPSPPPPDSQLGFNTRINPSMAIIIVVLIAAFFLMGFFSIYIRQCAGDSNASVHQAGGLRGGRSRRGAPRGLDTAVIETFPILEYSVVKGLKLGKGALECAVCLNEFEDNETLRLLPKCSHVFHPDCIDAWLSSHTTCPVCRSNLVPGSEPESAAAAAEAPDQETATNVENRDEAETADHVVIEVSEEMGTSSRPEVVVPAKMPPTLQNRPVRSRSSRRPMRFPRSHSTGHSLVQPGENMERYTLRVPEHVRKEIMSGKLQRTTSWVGYSGGGEGSSRGGRSYRGGGEGSSRGGRSLRGGGGGEGSSRGRGFPFGRFEWAVKSDRWVLSVTPPFFSRTLSMKSPKVADGEMTPGKKNPFASVKTPFECLGKPETDEEASARASTPVFTVSEK